MESEKRKGVKTMKPDELPGWQRVLLMMALRDQKFVDFLEQIIKEVKEMTAKEQIIELITNANSEELKVIQEAILTFSKMTETEKAELRLRHRSSLQ